MSGTIKTMKKLSEQIVSESFKEQSDIKYKKPQTLLERVERVLGPEFQEMLKKEFIRKYNLESKELEEL